MGALVSTFVKVAVQILAGVGIGSLVDKIAADKVPQYEPVLPDLVPGKAGFKPVKLVFLIVVLGLAAVVTTMIGKKFRIKQLR